MKYETGSYAVLTEQGTSASQMTGTKVMDIISRLPVCAREAANAVSAFSQVTMEDAPKLLKIPKSECPDIRIRLPLLKHGLEKISNWECLFVHREKGLFLSVYVDDIKLAGKKHNIDPMWKVLNKEVDPEHRDSHASSSHEVYLEPTSKRREGLCKHNVHAHFPKDRNCEICKRTNVTRAPCRRRNGEAVPRADNFGDLITADHKVLSDNCESRNNHRYAVAVQDLATQWIQACSCKNKTSQETQRSLQKFLEPERKPKVIYTDNSLEFGKACEDLSWNHCTSTPHRSETNGIAERAVRRVKGRHLCCIVAIGSK